VSVAPSGRQFEIALGDQRATVVELGGGIREYSVAGRAVLDPYPLESICDGAHGAPLIPWPNRVAGGRYRFDGSEHQLALTEPALGNAIHGLLRWRPWTLREHGPTHVVVQSRLLPGPGYPFALDLQIAYQLGRAGLTVATTAVNIGAHRCPYGAGQHPYLSPGQGLIDECTLELPAATRIATDERMIPTGEQPLAAGALDFQRGRTIGTASLDVGLTDLARDEHGRAAARLTGPDGRCVELWMDQHHGFVEVFTGDSLDPSRRRRGLAVEPMTCAANAFQSGAGLLVLEPGESLTTRWGVGLRDSLG